MGGLAGSLGCAGVGDEPSTGNSIWDSILHPRPGHSGRGPGTQWSFLRRPRPGLAAGLGVNLPAQGGRGLSTCRLACAPCTCSQAVCLSGRAAQGRRDRHVGRPAGAAGAGKKWVDSVWWWQGRPPGGSDILLSLKQLVGRHEPGMPGAGPQIRGGGSWGARMCLVGCGRSEFQKDPACLVT